MERNRFKLVLLGVTLILALVTILQNSQVVVVRFLFWEFSMSQIILIPLILLAGFLVGFFVGRRSWDWQ